MKKVLKITALFIFVLVLFSSCQNDEDTPEPNFDPRDDISAVKWKCKTTEGDAVSEFEMTIKKSETASDEIIFTNFHNWSTSQEATAILTGNVITFKEQTVNAFKLSGQGTIADNMQSITMAYTLNDEFEEKNVTALLTASAVSK